MDVHSIIKRPIITEKTNHLREEDGRYVFEVDVDANKIQIRHAVESIFNVGVLDVSTMIMHGKKKRFRRGFGKKPNWKKAVVTLRPEDTIDIFEGV